MPSYLSLAESGELQDRAERAVQSLQECTLCPRACAVDRRAGERGKCRTGVRALISSAHLHFGEESPLVGQGGSGTIFFSSCNLECIYCQNYGISQRGEGDEVEPRELAFAMIKLQLKGAQNINLVSPSHVVAQILSAVAIAADAGLRIPIVYNTGGYDSLETLRLLDGVVDIYMPDAKYDDPEVGLELSGIERYPEINRQAIKEMHRQVGDLIVDKTGAAVRGLLVRHLVLPNGLSGTAGIVRFLAEEISRCTYLNIMDQYRPCHRARTDPRLNRGISALEMREAVELARVHGLDRLAD